MLGAAFALQAAGLGKLSVYSAIGQPLNAEIAVTASPEELASLSARLAPHSAFLEAGIEMAPVLTQLQFKLDKSAAGQPVLRVTTSAPVNEPFLQFLLELNWASGRVVREYTFLLDPPEMLQVAKPVAAAPAMPAAKPVSRPEPMPAAPLAEAPRAPVAKAGGQEYRVKAGDTLAKIAREHKPETVSLEQMLVALFEGNRDAFDGQNMNRLRAGKILRVPEAAEAAQVDAGQARQIVIAQARDFNAYRRRLAEAAGAAAP
ncbi:MAG: LysM peptidoglycan-binding domain-containing protein, partial [Rhodocyclaceae bacterium]|nr:LysM peptidoglycan-binding domain-containing protein [Rhodocyclaceae bacterium]